MIREELKQEAEERANKFIEINFNEPDNYGSEKEVGHFSYYTGYLAGAEPREERIAALDKENGKLEGKLSDLQSEYIELENFHNNIVNGLKAQITKAKDIITNLVNFDSSYKNDEEYQYTSMLHDEIWEEAEHFLKEVEK